ncbi:MAG: Fe-S cluster assembly protein SufD [Flavobacteriales bacterium]|nr:Fe-S cluster assembly protein SufD [Flavobacteriales bacterium]
MNKKETFLKDFIAQESSSPYLQKLQGEARTAIEKLEFPTTRDEFWKYTRLGVLLNQSFRQAPNFDVKREELEQYLIDEVDLLVFVNGFYSEELSSIDNTQLEISPLAKFKNKASDQVEQRYGQLSNHNEDIFAAINTFYATNGVALHVKKNDTLQRPIQVLHISSGDSISYNPRNLIVLENSAEAEIYFTKISLNGMAFTNCVTEIFLEQNAKLNWTEWQNQGSEDYQINNLFVHQKEHSQCSITTITSGGKQIRNNIYVSHDGEQINTKLNGLSLAKNKQHIDNHTIIDHRSPNCQSFETYKGIAADEATIVFNGKVFVRQDAQKTNAFQSNNNILLSDNANIYSKPELEIYADDVKCSHGSTTGQIDEEALFYLRSRGIKGSTAKKLMIKAFAIEVLEEIKNEPFQNMVVEAIEENYFV